MSASGEEQLSEVDDRGRRHIESSDEGGEGTHRSDNCKAADSGEPLSTEESRSREPGEKTVTTEVVVKTNIPISDGERSAEERKEDWRSAVTASVSSSRNTQARNSAGKGKEKAPADGEISFTANPASASAPQSVVMESGNGVVSGGGTIDTISADGAIESTSALSILKEENKIGEKGDVPSSEILEKIDVDIEAGVSEPLVGEGQMLNIQEMLALTDVDSDGESATPNAAGGRNGSNETNRHRRGTDAAPMSRSQRMARFRRHYFSPYNVEIVQEGVLLGMAIVIFAVLFWWIVVLTLPIHPLIFIVLTVMCCCMCCDRICTLPCDAFCCVCWLPCCLVNCCTPKPSIDSSRTNSQVFARWMFRS